MINTLAIICRSLLSPVSFSIIEAKINNKKEVDVWGDGEQTRSFLFVDDCLKGTLDLFKSDFSEPLNIGSEEQVSINQMISIIEEIASYKVKRNYQLDKPLGVRGRSSDNKLVNKTLDWKPRLNLKQGLELTYSWIYNQITSGSNINKFTKSY